MSIRVALHHVTEYRYDRRVSLGPQIIRLRPAPHSRTPVPGYSLTVEPEQHFINWQQDPHGNFQARLVFEKPTDIFRVTVDLIADLTVINPFDFFVEEAAENFPFEYDAELAASLKPYLEKTPATPEFAKYLKQIDLTPRRCVSFIVELNQHLQQDIGYVIRLEPGVQTPEHTLATRKGSCRDSAWLAVQLLRHLGLAARFVSGYLIQLVPDQKPLEGPEGPAEDFTDLHAWAEVYLPGAGWVGLDPTSGLMTGEGHIPLAATPFPQSAAPISGAVDESEVEFDFQMKVTRIHEDPRVTKPYTEQQWSRINTVGERVDEVLSSRDVRLTMGGEPTFVSIDDMEAPEWNTAAVGVHKQMLSDRLLRGLRRQFAPGGLLHFGQGKWYPGEPLPRWAYTCLWRTDGEPVWSREDLLGDVGSPGTLDHEDALAFLGEFSERLGVGAGWIRPAHEDIWHIIEQEQKLPVDIDPRDFALDSPRERQELARLIERGGTMTPTGYVLPLKKAWWQARAGWTSGPWPFRSERLFLVPGDSPIGLRLPIDSLPVSVSRDSRTIYSIDPFDGRVPLPGYAEIRRAARQLRLKELEETAITEQHRRPDLAGGDVEPPDNLTPAGGVIFTAMCIEPRDGRLHVFLPPVGRLEDFLELVSVAEQTAEDLSMPVVLEGYLPPHDPRINMIKVTPDPGVIEVNVHPAHDWKELKQTTKSLYEVARKTRLGTEKFQLDGRHTGTGGGNHIVLGGATPSDSPFLRRPHVLRSLIAYWNNHPSLSYVFSGMFIGPTSQAPRVDEGRRDSLYELEIAFQQIPEVGECAPWVVDRVFRNLLIDLTGNTHRSEICIDKLYSPDHATGRLGLVELRGFEMPPHAEMSLTQQLLVRALIARFWDEPYRDKLIHWGTTIHDRFMLPHYLANDLQDVLRDLNQSGFAFEFEWFAPHMEFRCPPIGSIEYNGIQLELRQAIEPWYVLGEEPGGGGTARYVDSSVERLQAKVTGLFSDRYIVTCNGTRIPLQPTQTVGEHVAGVRYRAWQPPSCLHPTIPIHTPLVFDIIDRSVGRSIGGCRYHVDHPGGLNPGAYPINALEAESRRAGRFFPMGHTGGIVHVKEIPPHADNPCTLDLRRG
ncbi:MAG: transglutaminase family protein [Planctomycetaceae bacterium]|nr:transglutaminase family protein [Planctomycetaceae bacterium]